MGIGGGVLPYLHMIFSCPSCTFCSTLFVKQWPLSGMEGQCHKTLFIIIGSHQTREEGRERSLWLYELTMTGTGASLSRLQSQRGL